MAKYKGEVTITKTWSDVEVEAEDEAMAETMLGTMTEENLNKQADADEDTQVDQLECIEGCEEEEKDEN